MKNRISDRVAEEAARFMVEGEECEYLQAKERAMMMLGVSDQSRMPTNKKIREYIARLTKAQLGPDEVSRRVAEMRGIALEIMLLIDDFDPHLLGSTLSGEVRATSDIDLHAYSDNFEEVKGRLIDHGYLEVEEEYVENRKGTFVHLRWRERDYPVEITVYPWSWRESVLISSVTGKPMKRADRLALARMLNK
jgi:hypothetical protein